ncbi:hypothetical protein K3555_16425 [Leisingera sp. M527]|uniref:hypothetical protein n=1 Tax=unclassified Leisingera TaxID=2614906 RepID=UPI0021A8255E|nr:MULTISPECIES: hypothetical protein [unclassified Leisingera]UWQ29350.1 hypothetical protein K3557_01945 [Leisingera sp. M523]UWQ32137.1 hypothetical protein K3555_16425 [Leisingera sp. M527]UWQ74096.1 hypothetical protein K3724_16400 [Leisingera sp. M658]
MGTDLPLIAGLVIAGFSVPSILSAFSEQRPPRASVATILIAIGLIAYAVIMKPGGYRIDEIPDAFFRVLGRLL